MSDKHSGDASDSRSPDRRPDLRLSRLGLHLGLGCLDLRLDRQGAFVRTAPSPITPPTSARQQLANLEVDLDRVCCDRDALLHDRDAAIDDVCRLRSDLQALERHRRGQDAEDRRLHQQIADMQLDPQAASTQQLIADLRAQIVQQATEMSDLDRRLNRTQADLIAARATIDHLDQEVRLAGDEISSSHAQARGREHNLADMTHDRDVATASLDRVQSALSDSEKALSAARSSHSNVLQAARDVALSRVASLEADLRQARAETSMIVLAGGDLSSS